MHLIASHDAEGAIVAAALDDGEHHGPVPVPSQGLSVSRLELSTEQAELSLDVLCRRVRIDSESKALVPITDARGSES
ncbi:MAG: hypothetical protein ABI206_04885 [Antricoccus sp.]